MYEMAVKLTPSRAMMRSLMTTMPSSQRQPQGPPVGGELTAVHGVAYDVFICYDARESGVKVVCVVSGCMARMNI